MPNIELTKSQVENLAEFMEFEFVSSIRNNAECDNIYYLVDMCNIYEKLCEAKENAISKFKHIRDYLTDLEDLQSRLVADYNGDKLFAQCEEDRVALQVMLDFLKNECN